MAHFECTTTIARPGDEVSFLRPPRLMRVLAPLMAQKARRTWEERLRFIKDWIEAGAPPPGVAGGIAEE